MATAETFDPMWETAIYGRGRHLNRYPFDCVVTFVYRHAPREKPRQDVRLLEIGCGAGNNLWFAAREGFQVFGIDGSASAIAYAKRRFADDGLTGDLHVGDFTSLPYPDGLFDLAIDRGALTCCGLSAARQAVDEVARVLRPGGTFFCNPYSRKHTSHASGETGPDGLTCAISQGTLVGVGSLCFYGPDEVHALFDRRWTLLSVQHLEIHDTHAESADVHAEWRVVARLNGKG
jgi:SAM-dependent methyltransferase